MIKIRNAKLKDAKNIQDIFKQTLTAWVFFIRLV